MIHSQYFKVNKSVYALYTVCKYLMFHLKLAIANIIDWKDRQNPANLAIPPARLRHRVHGTLDKHSFLESGKTLAQNIHDLCLMVGRDIYSFEHILDFGCGSGRIIRNFQDAPASCHFYGTDIDSELVNWCEKNLPGIRWTTNGYQPPLLFADNTFDLIYGISVFTHLNEEFQHSWLRELQRIVKPKATIILSVHGEYCIKKLPSLCQNQVHSHGFLFLTGATGRLKLDKLPDFYQNAYHTEEYIHREWSKYFKVVRYLPRAIDNLQDAVLLQKL